MNCQSTIPPNAPACHGSGSDYLRAPASFRTLLEKERAGWTPLHHAVQRCDIGNASKLISAGSSVNAQDESGRTALHIAAQTPGSVSIAELLIHHGAQKNASGLLRKNVTPIHVAAFCGNMEVAALLIREGANVNAIDDHRFTPLHNAAAEGHVEVVSLLVSNGGSINARSEDGATPLYFAAKSGHLGAAKVLIGSGAKLDERDNQGNSPLTMAVHEGHAPLVKVLIEAGADVNARGQAMRTPIFWSTKMEVAKLLIEHGADVNAKDQYGNCPLHVASEKGHTAQAEVLLAKGATVDARNRKGRTPLHWAASHQIVELLVNHGADVHNVDGEGTNPCNLARREGRIEVAKSIRERTTKRSWWRFGR